MKVLIDTNILLDYLLEREPFAQPAQKIVRACQENKLTGFLAAHSITNMFFILRRHYTDGERRALLLDLCELFTIEGIDKYKLYAALCKKEFHDFEDCLQAECARACGADFIVTRNVKDFGYSEIPCVTPDLLCDIIFS